MATSIREYSNQQLRSIVVYGLDNDLISSAEFAAERLVGETGEDDYDSRHLYGMVLLKKNRFKRAYNLTANVNHVGCAYVFARAALELEKGIEGVYALTSTQTLWESIQPSSLSSYEFDRRIIPDAAVFFNLLGKLYYMIGDTKESAICHSKALKQNPFIWDSFEELNKMKANVKVKAIYKTGQPTSAFLLTSDASFAESLDSRDPFGESLNANIQTFRTFPKSVEDTPMMNSEPMNDFQTPRMKPSAVPGAPNRRLRSSSISRDSTFKQPQPPNVNDSIKRNAQRSSTAKVTSRLTVNQPLARAKTNMSSRKNSATEFIQKKTKSFLSGGSAESSSKFTTHEDYGDQHLRGIYATCAKAYKAMCRYDCFKAIRTLDTLSKSHINTPWVLSKLGRLHFEIVNYEESEVYFMKLRALDKTRVEDMEYYSTLLWHLHKDVELCHLAHELLSVSKNSPQTWVAVGNLFSLNREPDDAIKCFRRATQLDEKFSYAYTLQGHEYVANDAYEHALESFRFALLMDPKHYNALYGIGMVYLKLGNFPRAEFHFRKALDINPINVILICCLGMMLEKLDERDEALHQYQLACKIQPLSALALFKKAQLLFSMEQYNAALTDFEYLVTIAPDEASVHYLLGQLYNMAGRKEDAIKQYTIALNLDPKGSHLVKDALEKLSA
jgi:anaphase-promoting complex subunit 3